MAQQDWIEGELAQTNEIFEWQEGEPLITYDSEAAGGPWNIVPVVMMMG